MKIGGDSPELLLFEDHRQFFRNCYGLSIGVGSPELLQ